ncbi:hypothetical protein U1Q18_040882 [Sarracenia purpurea var. burkii]
MASLEARIQSLKGLSPAKLADTKRVASFSTGGSIPNFSGGSKEEVENEDKMEMKIQDLVSEVIGNPIKNSEEMALCKKGHDISQGVSAPVRELSDQVEALPKNRSPVLKIQKLVEGNHVGTVSAISVATEALVSENEEEGSEEDGGVDEEYVEGDAADREDEDVDEEKPKEGAEEEGKAKGETLAYDSDDSASEEDEADVEALGNGSETNVTEVADSTLLGDEVDMPKSPSVGAQQNPKLAGLEKQKALPSLTKSWANVVMSSGNTFENKEFDIPKSNSGSTKIMVVPLPLVASDHPMAMVGGIYGTKVSFVISGYGSVKLAIVR